MPREVGYLLFTLSRLRAALVLHLLSFTCHLRSACILHTDFIEGSQTFGLHYVSHNTRM